ncbi:hypothetical protein [Wolbachia endosymbiont of Pentidionis agamae]|uniref:hypothetical protein n=1 Tax=Wolbachia endosymbiont of Pentidionis agamae TaxID=3110435 RepID=UPI002FD79B8D
MWSRYHDCRNDGICGKSISRYEIINSNIYFYDNKKIITQIPKLPVYTEPRYNHSIYKTSKSKRLNTDEQKKINTILPDTLNFKYRHINVTVRFDSLSQSEQDQIKIDTQNAYDAFKSHFCIDEPTYFLDKSDINIYIFNNRNDYVKYNNLLNLDYDNGQDVSSIILGVTDNYKVLTYKTSGMDFILGHELGHVFQNRFTENETIKSIKNVDTELIANLVGREVEKTNHSSYKGQPNTDNEDYVDHNKPQNIIDVFVILVKEFTSAFFDLISWLFGTQKDENSSLLKIEQLATEHDHNLLLKQTTEENHYQPPSNDLI